MREFDSYYELFTQNESRDRFKILYVNLLVYYVSNFNKTTYSYGFWATNIFTD